MNMFLLILFLLFGSGIDSWIILGIMTDRITNIVIRTKSNIYVFDNGDSIVIEE